MTLQEYNDKIAAGEQVVICAKCVYGQLSYIDKGLRCCHPRVVQVSTITGWIEPAECHNTHGRCELFKPDPPPRDSLQPKRQDQPGFWKAVWICLTGKCESCDKEQPK